MSRTSLANQIIWITGGSAGIGKAIVYNLAVRGARLALTSRSEDELNTVKKEVEVRGSQAIVVPGDVTDAKRMKEIATEIVEHFGRIDMLIANAGTHQPTDPFEFDHEEYMRLMQINFAGMLKCIEACLPNMLERQSGRIVGMASLAGLRGLPTAAAYGASKSAMITFLESARFHLNEKGIEVTIIKPGFVKTPLTDKNDFDMPFLIEADKAARIICKKLEKGRDEISFPIPFNWIIKTGRILPYPIYAFLARRWWNSTRK